MRCLDSPRASSAAIFLFPIWTRQRRKGGATHAWMQVYLPGAGWVDFDPTNSIIGNRNLIRVAVAWDPKQVLPLWGTFMGPLPLSSAWTSPSPSQKKIVRPRRKRLNTTATRYKTGSDSGWMGRPTPDCMALSGNLRTATAGSFSFPLESQGEPMPGRPSRKLPAGSGDVGVASQADEPDGVLRSAAMTCGNSTAAYLRTIFIERSYRAPNATCFRCANVGA